MRTRFWDGKDKMIRDDVTWSKAHTSSNLAVFISTTVISTSAPTTAAASTISLSTDWGTSGKREESTCWLYTRSGNCWLTANWARDYAAALGFLP